MRENITIVGNNFPLAKFDLLPGEKVHIQRGSMIYRDPGVQLNTRVNASGSGIGKIFKAIGRAMTSGESFFITEAVANSAGSLALAPSMPGEIVVLPVGEKQYRINDGAFLALDGNASYIMKSQTLGRAIFSRTGGLFIMTTQGEGRLLVNAFGSIQKLHLNNESVTIDNGHVVAWDTNLNYDLHFDNNFFQSIGTGEGLVNTFSGTGDIYIQSLNLESFASHLSPLVSSSSGTANSSRDGGSNLVNLGIDLLT